MTKIDFKQELAHLYLPSAKEVIAVDVPPMTDATATINPAVAP